MTTPILERLAADRTRGVPTLSFELFPPRDDAAAIGLGRTLDRLAEPGPAFFSVTFGAGGSTLDRSLTVVQYIHEHTGVHPVAHLTTVGSTIAEMSDRVRRFMAAGICDFLALRGDPPADGAAATGELSGAAQLVELIRSVASEAGVEPTIGVAAFPNGHPGRASRRQDVDALLAKQQAGAAFAITQMFFRADDYLDYVDQARAAGVTIPILPGIAPITRERQLVRIAGLVALDPPDALVGAMVGRPPEAQAEIGEDFTVALATEVIRGGAPAEHYFTFNQHGPALRAHARVRAALD